ncbi:type II toxin-antitoxin system death-on-curing family toxin [Nocardia panacis]|uniref:Type II toxin-antitoxin system death-on-curing family toxin n=2 Tax=Nocardia panacis TaxID=2340916 RepID=A0A3A4K4V1_9NOCA|nr:type II toxin-antitoxin system death-on-curing family toxin [Nocardia panacis]
MEGSARIRDLGLLQSAIFRPGASAFGEDAYPDLFDKAAALLQSLARNHPFIDGNKRTAWLSTVTFLDINGIRLNVETDAQERLVISIATGEMEEIDKIAAALRHFR